MRQTATPPPQQPPPSAAPQQQPFMVQLPPPRQPERENLGAVIVGSFGLTGAIILAAVVAGATLASLWIVIRKWRRTYDHDAPPSLGPMPIAPDPPTRPPSSPDQ